MVIQHERQLNIGVSSSINVTLEPVAYVATNTYNNICFGGRKPSRVKGNKPSPLSTFCKKQRHTIDKCYRKHNFPSRFKFTKSKINQVNQIPYEKKDLETTEYQFSSTTSFHLLVEFEANCFPFTQEQYKRLASCIDSTEINSYTSSRYAAANKGKFSHFFL